MSMAEKAAKIAEENEKFIEKDNNNIIHIYETRFLVCDFRVIEYKDQSIAIERYEQWDEYPYIDIHENMEKAQESLAHECQFKGPIRSWKKVL